MLELSDDTQYSLRMAHAEARTFGSGVTGTEHAVLGMLRLAEVVDNHEVVLALVRYGVTLESVRNAVASMRPRTSTGSLTRSSANLLNALGIASKLSLADGLRGTDGDDYFVSARHLLLAMLSNTECGGTMLLAGLGVDVEIASIALESHS